MLARGFDGQVRLGRRLRFGTADLLFTLGWSALFVFMRIVDVPLFLGGIATGVLP
jgi:cobalt/nickel transport system permease protein